MTTSMTDPGLESLCPTVQEVQSVLAQRIIEHHESERIAELRSRPSSSCPLAELESCPYSHYTNICSNCQTLFKLLDNLTVILPHTRSVNATLTAAKEEYTNETTSILTEKSSQLATYLDSTELKELVFQFLIQFLDNLAKNVLGTNEIKNLDDDKLLFLQTIVHLKSVITASQANSSTEEAFTNAYTTFILSIKTKLVDPGPQPTSVVVNEETNEQISTTTITT